MIHLYLFSLLWSPSAWVLLSFRTGEELIWNLFDSAVAGLLTTMLVEYQWWIGLWQNIMEYINA